MPIVRRVPRPPRPVAEFGEERLRQVILASARGSAQEVLWAITGALAGFVGETEQADDVTGVVVRWNLNK